jgi:hypothetical protein
VLRTLTLADALAVVGRMRERDRQCVRAALGDVPDEVFAANRWQTEGPAWSLYVGGRPVAIGGVQLPNDWTGVFWMVAVEGMTGESWRKLVRHTRTVLGNVTDRTQPCFRHRVEAHVLSGWLEAAEFAKRLGFEHEGTRRAAGSAGEDIEIWTKVNL